jgi:hypothetical protein
MAIYVAAFVYALSSTSGLAQPYFRLSISQSISIARPFIFLFVSVVLAAPLYIAIYVRHTTPAQVRHDAVGQII